ncbi:hypothetical protein [Nocardia gipuzkoensis]|uniref:hypothetical protein n=1 Tax=Nocardia gipuzkoensis TaxID=2749991 RepID=UPI003EE36B19
MAPPAADRSGFRNALAKPEFAGTAGAFAILWSASRSPPDTWPPADGYEVCADVADDRLPAAAVDATHRKFWLLSASRRCPDMAREAVDLVRDANRTTLNAAPHGPYFGISQVSGP